MAAAVDTEERIYDDVREHIETSKEAEKARSSSAKAPKSSAQQELHYSRVDLKNRDVNDLNPHLKVQFNDIFGEPEPGTFSFDSVWKLSYKVYTATRFWCYRILTLIFALPIAFCWGLSFACLSCNYIWCCQPTIKSCEIQIVAAKRMIAQLVHVFCLPCYNAAGYMFAHIRVTQTQAEAPRDFDIV